MNRGNEEPWADTIGTAMIVCLAVVAWLVFVPLASALMESVAKPRSRPKRARAGDGPMGGRLLPIG
jgi:hypothetical protein